MANAAPAPKKRGSFFTILTFAAVFLILFDPNLRNLLGTMVGYALNPIIGFNGRFPVATILIAGTLMVLATTAMRHFTTDWLEMAKFQGHMRAFQKEMGAARKENNTYRLKKLTEKQPEMMEKQQEVSKKQLKNMPLTMIVVIPLFAWMFNFLQSLDYWYYSAPWNPHVDMWGTTVFQHWILLYMCLSVPLGALVQKTMKYLSWNKRWQPRHPDVHE